MRIRLATAVLALGLAACATLPSGKPTPGDPFERFNRSVWTFNNGLDHAVLRPVAKGYMHLPGPMRRSIHNFVTNFEYPLTIVNDLLQGQFDDSANDVSRLLVNTVFGIGGLFDPASRMDLARHDRDFGQTLGVWGLDTGPYVMLPFFGPSDVRDAFGRLGNAGMQPYLYLSSRWVSWTVYLIGEVDLRAGLLNQDQLIDSSFDSYAFVRNAYLQERRFKVHGSQPETPQQLFPGLEDDSDDSGSPAGPHGKPPGGAATSPAAPENKPPVSTVPPR